MHSDTSSPHDESTAKRRKVRKGTQSCWECKKRKVRCIYTLPSNTTCDNCSRRKTTCISQEYIDGSEASIQKPSNGVEARLSRVEDLLERLVTQGYQPLQSEAVAMGHNEHLPHLGNIPGQPTASSTAAQSHSDILLSSSNTVQSTDRPLAEHYTGVAHDLIKLWPNSQDLNYLCALPVHLATHLHMTTWSGSSEPSGGQPMSSQQMLQLPPPGSHPVLIARKLLHLVSLLQGALATSNMLGPFQSHFRDMMPRVFDAATRLITTDQDDHNASIEALECILLAAMIHNDSGNLHRSWTTLHRACAMAQMMGLHHGPKSAAPIFLDTAAKDRFDFDKFTFAIMNLDCYLSVALDLPRSSFETDALTPGAIAKCHPMERLARMQCIISHRLLDRKMGESASEQAKRIQQVDQLLRDAAAEMPPQWWLVPDFDSPMDGATNLYEEIGRVNYQFAHYLLTVQLHLPFLLRSSLDTSYDHSKFTAVNTSRDTLNLYIAFRKWNDGHFYCRGIDYLVFVAVTTLCVAHVDSHNQTRATHSESNVAKALIQSRLRDRGMMERTLQILQKMKDDVIAAKVNPIVQHLLDVEADSFSGTKYTAMTKESNVAAVGCNGNFVNGDRTYQLRMPLFGTINLERRPCSEAHSESTTATDASELSGQPARSSQAPTLGYDDQWSHQSQPPFGDLEAFNYYSQTAGTLDMPDDWTLQTINESLFNSLFGGMDDQDRFLNVSGQ